MERPESIFFFHGPAAALLKFPFGQWPATALVDGGGLEGRAGMSH